MFELADTDYWKSSFGKEGAHYNLFHAKSGNAMAALRLLFPDGESNEMNLILFSTSGVHGTYSTIEEVEQHLIDLDNPELPREVTFVVVQPRICCLRYGNCVPQSLDDIAFLKSLRESSKEAILKIGS